MKTYFQSFPEFVRRLIAGILIVIAGGLMFTGWLAIVPERLESLAVEDRAENPIVAPPKTGIQYTPPLVAIGTSFQSIAARMGADGPQKESPRH